MPFGHVPGDDRKDSGQRSERDIGRERRGDEHEDEEEDGVEHARDRATRPGAHIGGRARDGAGDADAAKQRRHDIGDALGDQFAVGAMAAAGHAIGDDGREQRLDGPEQREGKAVWKHCHELLGRDLG